MNYPQRNKSQLQLLKSAKIVSIIIKNEPKNLKVKTITEKIQYIEIEKKNKTKNIYIYAIKKYKRKVSYIQKNNFNYWKLFYLV